MSDTPNKCLSAATACLYGITEAAVLAAGYAPAIGFLHTGKPLSFVYDVADVYKFEGVVPLAFEIAAKTKTYALVVDDDLSVLQSLQLMLRLCGFDFVSTAADGAEAIERIRQ